MAIRRPRRAASACTHVRNAAPAGLRPRQMPQLACTSSARNSPGPTLVIDPRWRRSAELSSDGTKPEKGARPAGIPTEARWRVEHRLKGQRDDRPHPRRGHQTLRDRIARHPRRPRPWSAAAIVARQLLDHVTQRRDDGREHRRHRQPDRARARMRSADPRAGAAPHRAASPAAN